MPSRLLSSTGAVSQVDETWLSVATTLSVEQSIDAAESINAAKNINAAESSDTDSSNDVHCLRDAEFLLIEFQSSSDGRGFSVAAEFREKENFKKSVFASGNLLPDQLTLLFQCGFDGAIVDEQSWLHYGESAWMQALEPIVDHEYLPTRWQAIGSIWQRRAVASK